MFKNESSVVIALIFMSTYIFDKTKMSLETFNIQMDTTDFSFFYLILFFFYTEFLSILHLHFPKFFFSFSF